MDERNMIFRVEGKYVKVNVWKEARSIQIVIKSIKDKVVIRHVTNIA